MTIKPLISTLLAGSLLLSTQFATAGYSSIDREYRSQVEIQLELVKRAGQGERMQSTGRDWVDAIGGYDSASRSYYLEGGVQYHFVGVCDEDCTDVDLQLFDDGDLVEEDTAADDMPVIKYTPRWDTRVRVQMDMVECETNDCVFGVALLAR